MAIELLNCDCMDYLRDLPDKAFELAIVDPPYGIGNFNNTASKEYYKNKDNGLVTWNNKIPSEEYFEQLYRISKNRIIWGANYYRKYIRDDGVLIHDKTGGGVKKFPDELSECDYASHSFGVNMKIFHFVSCGNVVGKEINWKNEGINKRIHPCQKPIELYIWILNRYANEGDRIIDTHLGSGSSAIACHRLGFDFVGIEIDRDYFLAAQKRLKNEMDQIRIL